MSSDNIITRFAQSLEGLPKMTANSLSKHSDDIKERAEKVIDDIVKNFDVEGTIREVAEPLLNNALASAVKNHFESTSGKEAIKMHIENILKDVSPSSLGNTSPVEDSGNTAQEKPTDQTTTVPIKSPSRTFTPPFGTMLFSDPLTLQEIETLQEHITPITEFTLDGFKHIFESFQAQENPTHPVLILNRSDAEKISQSPFDDFFDPIDLPSRLAQGQMGHIFNMEVYSDVATGQAPFIATSGFLNKPTEAKSNHMTATQQTMAEVPPAS